MATRNRSRILAVLAVSALAAAGAVQAQYVRCESVGGQNTPCPAATPNGAVLAHQLGGSPCTLGVSWGWDGNGLWVSNNCRGEFRVVRDAAVPERRIDCDSDHGKTERCRFDTSAGFLLVPEDSSERCVAGKTWGWDVGSVWTSGNCNASFAVNAPERGHVVRCESQTTERVLCALNIDGGVTLEQEHRITKCVYGENWGLDARGVWVAPSCTATFRADGRLRGTPSWSEPKELACESIAEASDFCPADTSNKVTVAIEASAGICVQDRTWGFDAHGIWVSGGCRALFRLGD